jgi:hypothetical protein
LGAPLGKLVECIEQIEECPLVQAMSENDDLAMYIIQAKSECQHMLYEIKDMADWTAVKNGSLRSNSQSFSLYEAIKEVESIMIQKSDLKGISLKIQFEVLD